MSIELYSEDLAGVIVGETAISNVDGDAGVLSYRGVDITELAGKPFLQVVWLVICGDYPSAEQESALEAFMLKHGSLSDAELSLLASLPRSLHPMLVLQGVLPLLELSPRGFQGLDESTEAGLIIAAKIPALIAAWYSLSEGKPVHASHAPGFHQRFLSLFHGREPDAEAVTLLDTVQILQMEHSFNASTFAGRVCASTLAPIQSAISASIGTLYGVLHGGADQAALEMARDIASLDRAEDYVKDCLANKQKIMGMGHREYKTVDPRAKILKPMAMELCRKGEARQLLDILVKVEEVCREIFSAKDKDIWANVEFYKGAVFHSLGIPAHFFTAMFAMSRVFGYIAHFREFSAKSRLIRPRARYVP